MTHNTPVVIVAGMGRKTRAIGMKNDLIWHVPADMKRFKALTLGHPIIMGRKTFESIVEILGKPLPGRTNIIVTRNSEYSYPGTVTAASLEDAFAIALKENPTEIHIGGGAEMYSQALPFVDKIYITLFDDDTAGDTTFPEFENNFKIAIEHLPQEHEGLAFQWVDYVRK
jgi:dihydrofolate reductase